MEDEVIYGVILIIIAIIINIITVYIWMDNKYTRKYAAFKLMLMRIFIV